jgi:hypothetical protein
MHYERVEAYRVDVYNMVFQMLDSEPDLDGDYAGRVAAATSRAFEKAILAEDGDCPDCRYEGHELHEKPIDS